MLRDNVVLYTLILSVNLLSTCWCIASGKLNIPSSNHVPSSSDRIESIVDVANVSKAPQEKEFQQQRELTQPIYNIQNTSSEVMYEKGYWKPMNEPVKQFSPPAANTIQFRDSDDSNPSSSSRGLKFGPPHDLATGYGYTGYEGSPVGYDHNKIPPASPPYSYEPHYILHGSHEPYSFGEPHGYGPPLPGYNRHALAVKTLLWPLAGLALLGVAAAVVSNPVLLQLGVVSNGKRRKRRRRRSLPARREAIFNEPYRWYN